MAAQITQSPQAQLYPAEALITKQSGFLDNLFSLASQRYTVLVSSVFGDRTYQKKNQFDFKQKSKILAYLKVKNMSLRQQLQNFQKEKFFEFDQTIFAQKPSTLDQYRVTIFRAKQQLQAAKRSHDRIQLTVKQVKARYLSEQGYEFDKQRYNSMVWGLLFGAFVCGTYYRHGRVVRQLALVLLSAHVFGQINYKANLDRYFDSVYDIFEEEASRLRSQEKIKAQKFKLLGKAQLAN